MDGRWKMGTSGSAGVSAGAQRPPLRSIIQLAALLLLLFFFCTPREEEECRRWSDSITWTPAAQQEGKCRWCDTTPAGRHAGDLSS